MRDCQRSRATSTWKSQNANSMSGRWRSADRRRSANWPIRDSAAISRGAVAPVAPRSACSRRRRSDAYGRRAIWANKVKLGSINGPGEVQELAPFFKRYFLGGSTSIRGWGRFQVSPLSGSGLAIGGHSMLEASTELRVPVWGNLSAVLFGDAGNVWTDPWDIQLGDLRYAVGSGLRYHTPIGPVRFDIGYQLNPIDGLLVQGEPQQRRFRMHFSIGQAF